MSVLLGFAIPLVLHTNKKFILAYLPSLPLRPRGNSHLLAIHMKAKNSGVYMECMGMKLVFTFP